MLRLRATEEIEVGATKIIHKPTESAGRLLSPLGLGTHQQNGAKIPASCWNFGAKKILKNFPLTTESPLSD